MLFMVEKEKLKRIFNHEIHEGNKEEQKIKDV